MSRKKITKFIISMCVATILCVSGVNFGSWTFSRNKNNSNAASGTMTDVVWSQISSRGNVIHTGTNNSWDVTLKPYNVYLFEVWGAQGSAGQSKMAKENRPGGAGGKGSYATGWYDMRESTSDVVVKAFAGNTNGASNLSGGSSKYNGVDGRSVFSKGGIGGGASGIHIGNTALIIAGGGGGGGGSAYCLGDGGYGVAGGDGGGMNGYAGTNMMNTGKERNVHLTSGKGGTQSSNGANGTSGYSLGYNRGGVGAGGGGGGGGGGGWNTGYYGGTGASDHHGTQGRTYLSAGGGGSAGAFYTGGVQSIVGNSISTSWEQRTGNGMVKITEYLIDFPVSAPNSRSEQFTTSASSLTNVIPNGEFTFTMTLDESRTQANPPNITVNNASVSAGAKKYENGKYTITYRIYDVTGPITPADYIIDDLPINKYDVASPTSNTNFEGGGYVFSAPSQNIVNHGSGYTFTLTLNISHSDSSPIVKLLRNGNITQVEFDGVNIYTYTVSNVKDYITAADFDVNVPINKYSLIFDPNGGNLDPDFDGFVGEIAHGQYITEPPMPTRTGYTFHGWWESPDNGATLSRQWNFATDTYTTEMTLYAKWVPYTINLSYKNEDGGEFLYTNLNGALIPSYSYEGTNVVLPSPTRNGYDFGGWFLNGVQLDNNTLLASHLPANPSHNMTIIIHARWIVNTYYITYENIDGTTYGSSEPHAFNLEWFDIYPTEFTVESNDIILPEPTRHGWDFKGWHYSRSGNDPITQISSGRFTNITVFAEWEEWEYEILIQRHNPALPNSIRTVTIKHTELSYDLDDLNFDDTPEWLFKGWVYLSDLPIENATLHEYDFNTLNESGQIIRRTTVVAKWHAKVMNIKFRTYVDKGNFDGYDNVDTSHIDYQEISISVNHDESIPFIYTPAPRIYSVNGKDISGYYFSHWAYLDTGGAYVYFNPTTDRIMANVTLHAYWVLNTDSVQNVMNVLYNIDFYEEVFPPYDQMKLNALRGLMTKAEQMISTGYVGTKIQYPDDVGIMTLDLITALDDLLDDAELLAKIDALAYLDMLVTNLINMLSLSEFADHFDEINQLATDVLDFMERHISTFTLEDINQMTQDVIDFFESLGITINEGGQPDLPLNPPNQQLIYVLNQKISELEFYEEHSNNIRLTDTLKTKLENNMEQARQLLAKINKTDAEMENMLYILTQLQNEINTYMATLASTEQLATLQDLIITMTAYDNDADLWAFIGNYHKQNLQIVLASATSTTNGFNDPKLSMLQAQSLIGQLETMKDLIDKQIRQASLNELRTYIDTVKSHLNAMPDCDNKVLLTAACDLATTKATDTTPSAELKTALSNLKSAFEAYKNPDTITPDDPNKPNPNIYIITAIVVSLMAVVLVVGFIVIKKRKKNISKLKDTLQ